MRSAEVSEKIKLRRVLSAAGLPDEFVGEFAAGGAATLRVIGTHCIEKGSCVRPVTFIADRAGVSATTVRSTIRLAEKLGLIAVECRKEPGRGSVANIIRSLSAGWLERLHELVVAEAAFAERWGAP
jgi:hypothetical protein